MTLLTQLARQFEPLTFLKMSLKLLLSLLFALVLFCVYVLFTSHGAKMVLSFISEVTPYHIEFASIEGNLVHALKIHQFHLKSPTLEMNAKVLESAWEWQEILRTEKKLHYLNAQGLTVFVLHEKKANPLMTQQPSMNLVQSAVHQAFPIPIHIENIHITDATLNWNHHTHRIAELILKQASTTSRLPLSEIHYRGTWGTLHATFEDTLKADWELHLKEHPYTEYFKGPIITQGHISLPHYDLADLQNQIRAQFQVQELQAGRYQLKDFSLHLDGTLASHQAVLKGSYQNSPLTARIQGHLSSQQWQAKIEEFSVKHVRWEKMGPIKGELSFDWQHAFIDSSLKLLLWENYRVAIHAVVDKSKPHTLSGTIKTQIEDLKSLSAFLPDLSHLRGKALIDLILSGDLSDPQITGEILVKDSRFNTITAASKASLQTLRLIALKNKQFQIKGEGTWGSGPFNLIGEGCWNPANPAINLSFKGNKLLLSDTPEYYVLASPDLKLTLKNNRPYIEGSIFIPKADIRSLKHPDMVMASNDVVVISKDKTNRKSLKDRSFTTSLASNIDIRLGEDISYKGFGITTQVGGKIHLQQALGGQPNAQGKLLLMNGKYRGYGKTFDIDEGQILFTGGPIYDPIINIRAQRKIENLAGFGTMQNHQSVIAGIAFNGNLKSPKIGFYSSPSMPDNDIISYLIVGHPQHKITDAQGEIIFQALSQLTHVVGGKSRNDVQFDLAEKLKLDQLGFSKKPGSLSNTPGHNPLEDTMFVLGKQLSDRLYLHYSVGLSDSVNSLGLRYLIGKNLVLEASTGTDASSADLLMSFEGR